jgi:hypothetical protein
MSTDDIQEQPPQAPQDAQPAEDTEEIAGKIVMLPKALPKELHLKRNFEMFTLYEREKHKPKGERKWTQVKLAERYDLDVKQIMHILYQTRRHVDWKGDIPHANLFAEKVNENDPPIIAAKIGYVARDRKTWLRWVPRFLGVYAQTGNVTQSCKAAKISAETVRLRRKRNRSFARQMDNAFQQSIELKEGEVDRRAFRGFVVKTHYYKGKVVGKETGFSDLLAMFRLKKLNPEYRDNHNQKIQVDVNVKHEIDGARRILADPEARKQALILARKLALEPPKELIEPLAADPSESVLDDSESQLSEESDDQVGDDSGA